VISYYGLGNAAPAPANPTAPAYLYGRTHPMLEGYARGTLGPHLFEVAGGSLTLNWLDVPANGRVASDMRSASPGVRSLLGDARTHAVGILQQSENQPEHLRVEASVALHTRQACSFLAGH